MFGFAKAVSGRHVAAGASAAAAAIVSHPTADARVAMPGSSQPRVVEHSKIQEDWTLADLGSAGKVLFPTFSAAEIDECIGEVAGALNFHTKVSIEEVDRNSDITSEGTLANQAMDAMEASYQVQEPNDMSSVMSSETSGILRLASLLLRRPGMQHEILACMASDAEIRHLMLRELDCNNVDNYLASAGFLEPLLLPPCEAPVNGGSEQLEQGQEEPSFDLVRAIVSHVSGACEAGGSALSSLGGWLRRTWVGGPLEGSEAKTKEEGGQQQQQQQQGGLHEVMKVLGPVVLVMAAVFCLLLMKRRR
jgi:hypothetical protein